MQREVYGGSEMNRRERRRAMRVMSGRADGRGEDMFVVDETTGFLRRSEAADGNNIRNKQIFPVQTLNEAMFDVRGRDFAMGAANGFQFNVDNRQNDKELTLGILPGHFDTSQMLVDFNSLVMSGQMQADNNTPPNLYYGGEVNTGEGNMFSQRDLQEDVKIVKDYQNLTGIRKFIPTLDLMLQDCENKSFTFSDGSSGILSMSSTNRMFSIENFIQFTKYFKFALNRLTFQAKDLGNYNGRFIFSYTNPFRNFGTTEVFLQEFFDVNQQQDNKMTANVRPENPFIITPHLLWAIVIPPKNQLTLTLYL